MFGWKRLRRFVGGWRRDSHLLSLLASIEGKSVAVVGNAKSLICHSHGRLIDSHEVVIRMNHGFPIDPVSQGTRFDVWCFSTIEAVRQWPQGLAAAHALWMSPKWRDEYDRSFVCGFYPLRHWHELRDRLGARPSVGAMTIDLVSRATPREVTVLGFDFKRTNTLHNDIGLTPGHDFRAEERFVEGVVARRSWRFVSTYPVDGSVD